MAAKRRYGKRFKFVKSYFVNSHLDAGTQTDITSTNLYRGYDVMDSPFTVNVQPAGTCAAKSIAVPNQAGAGHSLELSTAGLQAEFTITVESLVSVRTQ